MKWSLMVGSNTRTMPAGAEILAVNAQEDRLRLWAMVGAYVWHVFERTQASREQAPERPELRERLEDLDAAAEGKVVWRQVGMTVKHGRQFLPDIDPSGVAWLGSRALAALLP